MKQKGFALIMIIVLIALFAVAGVCFAEKKGFFNKLPRILTSLPSPTPIATPDPTIDWKTYTNKELGFSFKHPLVQINTDKLQAPNTPTAKLIQTFAEPDMKYEGSENIFNGFSIYQIPNISINKFEDFVESDIEAIMSKKSSEYPPTKEIVQIDNTQAICIDLYGVGILHMYYFLVPNTSNLIVISEGAETYSTNQFKNIFPQILSTFKFNQ